MDRAEELFNKIKNDEEKALDDFISERKSEELFLDFKRSANNGTTKLIDEKDRINFAKAISGFGNSEGGIIVWGVDCSNDKSGQDVAKAKIPIQNPKRFESNLNNLVSGRTIPSHTKVENYSFITDLTSDSGFVVSYIPKCSYSPIQAIPSKDFYVRVGSSFEKASYSYLASQFGQKPYPNIVIMYNVGMSFKFSPINKAISRQIGFLVTNIGSVFVERPYFNLKIRNISGENCQVGFQATDTQNWVTYSSFDSIWSMLSKKDYVVAPDTFVQPAVIEFSLSPPFTSDLHVIFTFGCENSITFESEIKCSKDEISDSWEKYISKYNELLIQNQTLTEEQKKEVNFGLDKIIPLSKKFINKYE